MDKQPLATETSSPYHQRRLLLAERMRQAGGGVALIPTAPEMARNRDTQFPYRADSYFQYLTGFSEPEAALLLIAGRFAEDQGHPVLPREECRAGNLGWLSPRPGRRA
jgi:Xaa-Pro aminopeptidase